MSNQQIQKVKVKRLARVGLWTHDVTTQARFYHQVLGMDVLSTSEDEDEDTELEDSNMLLGLHDDAHALGLFTDNRPAATNGRRPVPRTSLHHLSFEVDTDAELAALAARLKMLGIDLSFGPRDGDPELGDTLWLNDPDGNRIEISATLDDLFSTPHAHRNVFRPDALQHVSLYTIHLEAMVEFYTEALGFDISDWLLRERAWLRSNANHHSLLLIQGKPGIDHIGFSVADNTELLRWADYLSRQQIELLWGPGRHGTSGDTFIRFADADGIHIELSADMQQYYEHDVTVPPRLWHTRGMALNVWGPLPNWIKEEAQA
ncbi:VOC family protein [Ktedonobacteria bacterium brp13]|nr:VOC family protein [Ktedonobacteria bacterium brp13]